MVNSHLRNMKSLDGQSHSLPPCPYCEKGEYNLCGHKNIMNNSNEKSKEHICKLCRDGGFTLSPCPHNPSITENECNCEKGIESCIVCQSRGWNNTAVGTDSEEITKDNWEAHYPIPEIENHIPQEEKMVEEHIPDVKKMIDL